MLWPTTWSVFLALCPRKSTKRVNFFTEASRQFVEAFDGERFPFVVATRWRVFLHIFTVTAGASEPH